VWVLPLIGGAADKAGNRFERRWTLLALLDVLAGEAQSLQVEVPGEEGAGAEFLQVRADGVLVWHQVKRQHARSSWTIRSLVREKVIVPWWPKISSGGRFVFVSSTSAQELEELVERASAAESWQVFDEHFLKTPHRDRFERLRQAWENPPGPEAYAALRNIEVRQIGESDLKALLQARLATLVEGPPATAMAVLEQFIDESAHRRLTAPDVRKRCSEHHLQPLPRTGTGRSGSGHRPDTQGSPPVVQLAESSGNAPITQIAGNYISIQAPRTAHPWKNPGRNKILAGAGGTAALIAVAAAITAFTGSPADSRLPVLPLASQFRAQFQPVQVQVTRALQAKLGQASGQAGAADPSTMAGYQFRNAWNQSAPLCLGALDTGPTAEHDDPVQALSCSNLALNEIWIPAQWDQNHQELTWLVNAKYQSMCLNVTADAGQGTHAHLYKCYHTQNGPYGLASYEAWDFSAWYDNMKSGTNPYPIFLGSGGLCLDANNDNADPGKDNQLPDGTTVTMWDYYHVARNQYWS
jgi:hypothetical protein